jgi:hypothetical protein
MKVYAIIHHGEKKRYYNIRSNQFDDKLSADCLGDKDQIEGLANKWRTMAGGHADDRYEIVRFNLTYDASRGINEHHYGDRRVRRKTKSPYGTKRDSDRKTFGSESPGSWHLGSAGRNEGG